MIGAFVRVSKRKVTAYFQRFILQHAVMQTCFIPILCHPSVAKAWTPLPDPPDRQAQGTAGIPWSKLTVPIVKSAFQHAYVDYAASWRRKPAETGLLVCQQLFLLLT